MKKLILILMCLLSLTAQAEIQVQVDPSQIIKGDTFQLSLTQDAIGGSSVPDLSPLQKDFIILGTAKNVNYSVINGQSQSSTQWVITLQANKSGIVTIPALRMGSEFTKPITINISEGAQNNPLQPQTSKDEDLRLTATVSTNKPYVNQQILYKVTLYNRKRLLDAEYQPPKVEDALLIPLGDANRYQTTLNNKEFIVEEQTYAIYPQKSGNLKIISPSFSALIYDFNPKRVKVQDKPINLKVQPIPDSYKGANWLPASKVHISEKYQHSHQTISQGSTLVRTITIEAAGIPAQLIPSLQFNDSKEFNVYTEKSNEHNEIKQGELTGSVEIKVTYLFKEPGKVIIPEIKLPWFNTSTNKEEHATLAPRSMEIIPSATAATSIKPESVDKVEKSSMLQIPKMMTSSSNFWPWLIAALFAAAWLFTLILWAWQKRTRYSSKGEYKKALEEFKKSCSECNPMKARDSLIKWASLHWPDAPILNLSDLSKLVRDAHIKKQLHQLSQVLYKNEQKTLWRGDELAKSIQAISKAKTRTIHARKTVLPPINPK